MSEILSPNKYTGRIKPIRLIVIHTMEVDENDPNVAESVGRAFANPSRQASAHVGIDTDSECRYVRDEDTAWAAPGANADGLQIELAGRAGQVTEDWQDAASQAILTRAAQRVAQWCSAYGIPVKHLSVSELKAGAAGIVGHYDVTLAYRKSDHTDPGTAFPWDDFLAMVAQSAGKPVESSSPLADAPAVGCVTVTRSVADIQRLVGADPDGIYGADTTAKVKAWQGAHGLDPDGVWGPASDAAGFPATSPVVIAPAVAAPPFPLPKGSYFGPKSGPKASVSGYFSHREDLRVWQQRMKDRGWAIDPDGLYGPRTASITRLFQAEKGLQVDELIGPETWAAAWTTPVTR